MKFLWLILTGLFCLCMNVLLWRSEYGGGSKGNPLPVNKVVAKILDTPDPSELDIFYQGKPVGHCRWVVTQLGQDDPEESVLNASGAASWPIWAPWEASKTFPKSGVRLESAAPQGGVRGSPE